MPDNSDAKSEVCFWLKSVERYCMEDGRERDASIILQKWGNCNSFVSSAYNKEHSLSKKVKEGGYTCITLVCTTILPPPMEMVSGE